MATTFTFTSLKCGFLGRNSSEETIMWGVISETEEEVSKIKAIKIMLSEQWHKDYIRDFLKQQHETVLLSSSYSTNRETLEETLSIINN